MRTGQVELRHVAKFKGDRFEKVPYEFGDKVVVKNFRSRGTNLGDVMMRVSMHTCNMVQLENPRLGFRGWFRMNSGRIKRIEN